MPAQLDSMVKRASLPPSDSDEIQILLTSLREVIPPIAKFTDQMLRAKIGDRLFPCAEEFRCYIERDRVMMKNEKLAEGSRLMKLLVKTMRSREMPVTVKTVLDCMSWLEDAIVQEFNRAFPGYISHPA